MKEQKRRSPMNTPYTQTMQPFIAEQRARDWTDFHPETYCHRCGRENISWWVNSPEWNLAIRDETGHPRTGYPQSEILCVGCFVEAWEQTTGLKVSWELRIDPLTDPR
jgi:hypothetical protein